MVINKRPTPKSIQWWLYWKIPTLWWWGVKVKNLTEEQSTVSIRYSWFNQNPFRSAYFAALCGAGELSTGLLVRQHIADQNIAMLLTALEARFLKKAIGAITFTCDQGLVIAQHIETARHQLEGVEFTVPTVGYNEEGLPVIELWITWSVRLRRTQSV